MVSKLRTYIDVFNKTDDELYVQKISNAEAADFLAEQIPLIDCPDRQIEEIYYFRWWTYRKHIKQTERGHIITEFLPNVPWSGPHNSIVCPACFHIREGRWLKDENGWIKEYIRFWLNGHGNVMDYSSWLPHAVLEYCTAKQDWEFAVACLPQLVTFFEQRERRHLRNCGLYWSNDDRDGMEYSISGPGLRPTLNSYACADARAIAAIAKLAGNTATQARFTQKAEDLHNAMEKYLWDGSFYKTIPLAEQQDLVFTSRPDVSTDHDARELVGLIPWYFDLPPAGKESAFTALLDSQGFSAPFGLTTAEQRHPRFMEVHEHECLWNGPVWPFATSQTLVAVANLLHNYPQAGLTKADYVAMLHRYAESQHLTNDAGITVPWIDEDLHPYTGNWIARDTLKAWGWKPELGGYERGKDYNHSLFCDLVLSGLFGIEATDSGFTANPLIPDTWDYFRVENLWLKGQRYRITYDKDGSHYRCHCGLHIQTY